MDDFIICSACSSQFCLSNYQDFLNHKISKCSISSGNIYKAARQYACFHCEFMSTNADEFINHFEDKHSLKLLKTASVDSATETNDAHNIALGCRLRDFSDLSDKCAAVNGGSELQQDNITVKVEREVCSIDVPVADCRNGLSHSPLLDDCRVSPTTSRSTDINNSNELLTPQTTTMNGQYKYQHVCAICNKRFKQKVHLSKHILVKHENIRPYKCSICSYRTVEKGYLKTHMRKHTGERPFSCMVCQYTSSQNCALKVHMKRVHPDFSLDCFFCDQRFRTSLEFTKHEQTCPTRSNKDFQK